MTRRVNFQNPAALAGQDATPNMKFEREDWTSFRTIDGLQQKAGVPKDKLRRLALKELADNSLDAGGAVEVGTLPNGGYFVEDDGPGIGGSPKDILDPPSHDVVEVSAPAAAWHARQWLTCHRRGCASLRWVTRRHHPQPPHRAVSQARRQYQRG